MEIYKVIQDGVALKYTREGNAFFIELIASQKVGLTKELTVFYGGKPKIAVNPPWDGGITWKKDTNGKSFIASSCQGLGASVWWPNKDHMYDEVDNMLISVNVPKNLTDVSNGRLQSVKQQKDGTKTYNWYVSNPINNYGVNINIGDYVTFSEKFKGEKGDLDCTYYVLRDNLTKAKKHFQDVPRMLKAFEHWFGPYPFYEDSYKLVEVPYLGMEHQSSVTYGNGFVNGYRGRDLSGTGWGLKFDFIIIHESGHEWFANNITYKDLRISFLWDLRVGGDIYNGTERYMTSIGRSQRTEDRMTPRVVAGVLRDGLENSANPTANTIAVVPYYQQTYYTSMPEEEFIQKNVNAFRLRDITFNYNIKKFMTEGIAKYTKTFSVFLTVNDAILITNYKGADPAVGGVSAGSRGVGAFGFDYGNMGAPVSFNMGIRTTF